MLYGRRPFGDGMSQQKIFQEGAILREARHLEFPPKPAVSDSAKVCISK
jgi:tousled-like kinase